MFVHVFYEKILCVSQKIQVNNKISNYFTMVEMQVRAPYLRSLSLAQMEAILWSYCGRNQTTWRKPVCPTSHTNHLLTALIKHFYCIYLHVNHVKENTTTKLPSLYFKMIWQNRMCHFHHVVTPMYTS